MSHRHFVFGVLPLLLVTCGAGQMQPVRVSADNKGFIVVPSGAKFVPWGHNYAAEGLEIRPSCRLKRSNGTSLI